MINTQSPVEDFTQPARPKYPHALLLSRQAIRGVIATLGLPEEQELILCRQLINKIEDIIESI